MLTIEIASADTIAVFDLLEDPMNTWSMDGRKCFTLARSVSYRNVGPLRTVGTDAELGEIVVIANPDDPNDPVYVQWTPSFQSGLLLNTIREGCRHPVAIKGLYEATYCEYREMIERWIAESKRYGNSGRWFHAAVWDDLNVRIAAFVEECEGDVYGMPGVNVLPPSKPSKARRKPATKTKAKAPAKKRAAPRRKK